MAEVTSAPSGGEHSVRRKWFLALGLGLLLLGLSGVGATTLLELSSLLVFGPLLLTSSLIQLLTAFFAEEGKERLLHLTAAGLEAILRFFIMAHPLKRPSRSGSSRLITQLHFEGVSGGRLPIMQAGHRSLVRTEVPLGSLAHVDGAGRSFAEEQGRLAVQADLDDVWPKQQRKAPVDHDA
jgi:hypothetical protein